MVDNVLIIGASHAAAQVVGTLRQRKFGGSITLVGDEAYLPYQRPPLSKKYLSGDLDRDRLLIRPESFYGGDGITVRTGCRIAALDPARSTATSQDGEQFVYDKLILALGARPREVDLPGAGLEGLHYLRAIDDVDRIRREVVPGCRLTIVGAGYIGLEVAAVAAGLGAAVTVIEAEDRVLSRVVSPEVSRFFADVHLNRGVELLTSARVAGFAGRKRVEKTVLSGGREIDSDVVIVGVGAVPNVELAQAAGLDVGDGIIVDDACRTSQADILAIGDCTYHPNALLGRRLRLESVHNALEQGKTAALGLCGESVRYAEVPWFWSDQYDLKLQIAGLPDDYDRRLLRGDPEKRSFACLYLRGRRLVAIEAVNEPRDFMQARPLIGSGAELDLNRLSDKSVPLKDLV